MGNIQVLSYSMQHSDTECTNMLVFIRCLVKGMGT